MKKFRVSIVFEFDNVEANSPDADAIVSMLSNDWDTLQTAYDAQGVWVDDAYNVEGATA